jgi:NitT/TauT family transport system substrate-binding protein
VAALLVGAGPAPAQVSIRMGYIPVESHAAEYVAQEKGYYRAQGLTTELVRLPSGAAILTQVSTGDLQVGGGALGAAGFNAIHGKLPVAFVAPMHYSFSEDYFMVRKVDFLAGRIKTVADLKGKPCAVNAKGVATEWMLEKVLRRYGGIGIEDVDLKALPFPEQVAALENGAISCGIVSEPFATLAEEKGVATRPFQAPVAKPDPITMVFWNTDWAKKNEAAARGFMTAYLRAVRDLSEPGAYQQPAHMEMIAKYTGVTPAVLAKTRRPYFNANLELDEKVMMDQQEFNLRRGYLKYTTAKPIKELVDLSVAEVVVRQMGRK